MWSRISSAVPALGALALALAPAASALDPERPPVLVSFADGSSLPLRAWALSYEYTAWRKGQPPTSAAVARKEATDLLIGSRTQPTSGLVLEIVYVTRAAEGSDGGEPRAVANGLRIVQNNGKRSALKLEPPVADALGTDFGKTHVVQARSLDIKGETLTGGTRSYCLASYSILVECAAPPQERVVRLQFPP